MRTRFTLRQVTLATLTLAAAGAANATNGYFSHGYGIKAKGMGGAAVAMAQDGFAGANNPAAAAFAGNRWDLGADVFMPVRSTTIAGNETKSGKEAFLVPEFGYNVALSNKLALGLTVYGNGGMNTSYPVNFFLGGSGKLGVDLIQLIVAPTVAYKISDNHSIGVSPLLVYQRFQAYGLQGFGLNPNQGTDDSTGLGIRLGYQGRLNDVLTVGASYSPKINMSRFDKYANLFAEEGDFDIPENYTLGFALQATPTVQLALDFQRINYSRVKSIGNTGSTFGVNPLGAPNGPGFGWTDVNVVKLGVQWRASEQWAFRAGYNHGDNPIKPEEITLNSLAPGVVKSHITLGATYSPTKTEEWSFAYMHAKKNSVSVPANFGGLGGPDASISMYQNSIGIQYSRKF